MSRVSDLHMPLPVESDAGDKGKPTCHRVVSGRWDADVVCRIAGKLGVPLGEGRMLRKTNFQTVGLMALGFERGDQDWSWFLEPMINGIQKEIFVGIGGFDITIGVDHGWYTIRVDASGFPRDYEAEMAYHRLRERRRHARLLLESQPGYSGERVLTDHTGQPLP